MKLPEDSSFLNVDLDVEAPFDLGPLVEALGDRVSNMYTGPGLVGFETHLELSGDLVMPSDADVAVRGFVSIVSTLPPSARRLWDDATRKEFNIGIQAGSTPPKLEIALESETVADVARLGARIGITVYAFDTKHAERVHRRRTRR
jgi:hypothetical protein